MSALRQVRRRGLGIWLFLVALCGVGLVAWFLFTIRPPILPEHAFQGTGSQVVGALGPPQSRHRIAAEDLRQHQEWRELFGTEALARLGERQVEVLEWRRRFLGVTAWRFALGRDAESHGVLFYGGRTLGWGPVFLGGGRLPDGVAEAGN